MKVDHEVWKQVPQNVVRRKPGENILAAPMQDGRMLATIMTGDDAYFHGFDEVMVRFPDGVVMSRTDVIGLLHEMDIAEESSGD